MGKLLGNSHASKATNIYTLWHEIGLILTIYNCMWELISACKNNTNKIKISKILCRSKITVHGTWFIISIFILRKTILSML